MRWSSLVCTPLIVGACFGLSGCGLEVPAVGEVWEDVHVTSDMELRIKQNIFCETVAAIRWAKQITVDGKPALPDGDGVQMEISLTMDEVGATNPGVTFTNPLASVLSHGSEVAQSFSLAAGGSASSTATRTDITYSYYNVGKISAPHANIGICSNLDSIRAGSSPLLRSDLGIQDYLSQVLPGLQLFPSSTGGPGSAKINIFSYEIKFVVVTNANITPTWKLVNVTASSGSSPLLNLGRTRTHDLTLTFGPGANAPDPSAVQAHFTSQIVQSNRRQR